MVFWCKHKRHILVGKLEQRITEVIKLLLSLFAQNTAVCHKVAHSLGWRCQWDQHLADQTTSATNLGSSCLLRAQRGGYLSGELRSSGNDKGVTAHDELRLPVRRPVTSLNVVSEPLKDHGSASVGHCRRRTALC